MAAPRNARRIRRELTPVSGAGATTGVSVVKYTRIGCRNLGPPPKAKAKAREKERREARTPEQPISGQRTS